MGAGSYSPDYLGTLKMSSRSAGYHDTFKFDADVKTGKVEAKVHEDLDPSKMKGGIRESRDSAEHPISLPIAVCLDVTGSMSSVPKRIIDKMPSLMGCFVKNGFDDTQVLFGAVGDTYCDKAPFQVTQFETDNRIDDQLSKVYCEGGGGGNRWESYSLFFYMLARCTQTDHYDKRGEKGYAFLIQDEPFDPAVTPADVKNIFDQDIQAKIPLEDIIAEAKEKWNIFIIRPQETSCGRDESITAKWEALFPQHVIKLDKAENVCETIALAVAAGEGTDLDEMVKGFDGSTADFSAITSALTKYTGGLAKKASGELVVADSTPADRL